jgi:4'-phosphopantetheinyl transferase
MEIDWLEQRSVDVPLDDAWLCAGEQRVLAGLKVPKRRTDWRLGRWTAKQAVAAYLQLPSAAKQLAAIEIRPATSGAPEVFLDNHPANASISLSHRGDTAACAVAPPGGVVGCDLELVESHSDAFISDYFTAEEHKLIAQSSREQRDRLVSILWSAKESALKALRTGLRIDTRAVSASLSGHAKQNDDRAEAYDVAAAAEWCPLRVCYEDTQVFAGWWKCVDELVRTVISVPAAGPPTPLSTPGRF